MPKLKGYKTLTSDEDFRDGQIRFAGTRIALAVVMEHIDAEWTDEQILETFGLLTPKMLAEARKYKTEASKNKSVQ